MNTNFFSTFKALGLQGVFRIGISVTGENMCVSILPITDEKQPELHSIPPLVFNNLPAEAIDNAFFDDIVAPIQRLNTALSNKASFEKVVDKVGQPPAKATTGSSAKTMPPVVPAKFTAAMNKVEELVKQGKIGQAISALPKVSEFPAQQNAIENKLTELKVKHGGFASFLEEPTGSPATTPDREQRTPSPAPQTDTDLVSEDEDTPDEEEEEEDWTSREDDTHAEESTFFDH